MRRQSPLISVTALLALSLGVVSCGGGSHDSSSTSAASRTSTQHNAQAVGETDAALSHLSSDPKQILARVADKAITLGTVLHQMRLSNVGVPLPDPPRFTACIERLTELSAHSKTPPAERTEDKLRQNCESFYVVKLQEALITAIHQQWIAGEAAELGIKVSPREIQEEADAGKKVFKSDAEFRSYMKKAGETIADIRTQAKLNRLTEAIFAHIKAKEHPVTAAEVARYYASHRAQFTTPQGRHVRIVRTATASSAAKVKQQLQSGKSFAAVAKELSTIGQPIGAENGEVVDLKPGVFEEKVLNDAIFKARPRRLYGPLQLTAIHKTIAPETNTGFFLFEVVSTTPGGVTPLARVRAGLTEELAKAQKEKTYPPFILGYRRKWRARTDCETGYVVQYCRQFKGSKAQVEGDPYTL